MVFPRNRNEVWKMDPRGKGSLEVVGNVPGPNFHYSMPATMFDKNKVLIITGTRQASVVDISDPDKPISQRTGALREPRYWVNSVALPNGEVLVVGGASESQKEEHAVKYAEIWNPETGQWRIGAMASKSRLYHSAAILLPDATVLVGGGGTSSFLLLLVPFLTVFSLALQDLRDQSSIRMRKSTSPLISSTKMANVPLVQSSPVSARIRSLVQI